MSEDLVEQEKYRNYIDRARDAHTSSTHYFDANIRHTVEANLRQFQGLHPAASKYHSDAYKNRSKLFRPKTRAAIRKDEAICAGAFFTSEDVTSIRALNDNDPYSKAAADVYKALLQYRLTKPAPHGIPWFLTLVGAYQEAMTSKVVVSKQDWQYDPQAGIDRPRITLKPVENVRIDPASDWTDPVNSSPYLIDMIPMYLGEVKRRMQQEQDGQPKWFYLPEGTIRSAVKSADTIRLTREGRTDSKDQSTAITDYTIVWVHENIMRIDGQDVVYYTLGTEFILSEPRRLKEVYFHGIRPFAMGICVIEAHKIYPSSKTELVKETQKELNEIVNERRDNVKRILDPRWKVKRNTQVDLRSLTRNVPSSVTLMNALADAEAIVTPDATGACFQEQDRVNGDFDEIGGNFSSSSVQNNRRLNETVGGMDILTADAGQVGEYQLRTFTVTWVEPVLRQILLLEKEHETDETILALAAEAAQIYEQGLTLAHMDALLEKDVILAVNVGIGATNPTAQLDRFVNVVSAAVKLLGPDVEKKLKQDEVIKELFGKAGYQDGARFFDFTDKGPDPMEQLQEAILQAKLDLTKAQTEKTGEDAALSKASKLVKMVEAIYEAMQTAGVAVSMPGTTTVADSILGSVGFVDQDTPPIVPMPAGQEGTPGIPVIPKVPVTGAPPPIAAQNTHPNLPTIPASAAAGAMHGIETPRNDGVTA
jgi:hypothetical protein